MPPGHRDARGRGWVEREEVSFTPRDALPHAASASCGLGLQHALEAGSRLDRFPEASSPFGHPRLQPSSPPALSLLSQPTHVHCSCPPMLSRLRRSRKPHDRSRSCPTCPLRPHVSPPSHAGLAGPGISGKTNSGGEQVTRSLGVFVFWQARGRGGGGPQGHFSFFFLFGRQTNDENPAIGAREPGVRLLGGR